MCYALDINCIHALSLGVASYQEGAHMAMSYSLGYSRDNPGVQVLGLPQDTAEAAKQAITPQAPGSEFNPPPHPDVQRVLARLKELDKECTALCDKLYMGTTPSYEQREEIQDKLQAADAERSSLRAILNTIYEANEGKEAGDTGKPYSDPSVQVMYPDATASMAGA